MCANSVLKCHVLRGGPRLMGPGIELAILGGESGGVPASPFLLDPRGSSRVQQWTGGGFRSLGGPSALRDPRRCVPGVITGARGPCPSLGFSLAGEPSSGPHCGQARDQWRWAPLPRRAVSGRGRRGGIGVGSHGPPGHYLHRSLRRSTSAAGDLLSRFRGGPSPRFRLVLGTIPSAQWNPARPRGVSFIVGHELLSSG